GTATSRPATRASASPVGPIRSNRAITSRPGARRSAADRFPRAGRAREGPARAVRAAPADAGRARLSGTQPVSDQAVDHPRVRAAPGLLHHLTHEKGHRLILARADVPDRPGVLGDDLLDDGRQARFIADLRQPALLDDRLGGPPRSEHLLEDLFCRPPAHLAGIDEAEEAGKVLRTDRHLVDLAPRGVEIPRHVSDEPVADRLRLRKDADGALEEFR